MWNGHAPRLRVGPAGLADHDGERGHVAAGPSNLIRRCYADRTARCRVTVTESSELASPEAADPMVNLLLLRCGEPAAGEQHRVADGQLLDRVPASSAHPG